MSGVKAYLGLKLYPFRLDVPGLSEVESQTGLGLWHLAARMESRTCTAKEVQLVFHHGLMGAGLAEQDALALTGLHCVPGRLEKARAIAFLVLSEAIHGVDSVDQEVDPPGPGKPDGEGPAGSGPSPAAGSTSPPSGAASPVTGSPRRRSKARSPKT